MRLAAKLYPREWREEYGEEFDALLTDTRPGWRAFANVLKGAIAMHLTTGTNWLKLTAGTTAAGLLVAGGLSFTVPPRYVSSAVVSLTPQPDPARVASPEELRQRTANRAAQMKREIMSRTALSWIIPDPALELYPKEREKLPLEDVIEKMRGDLRIEARASANGPLSPIVLSISFSYPDQAKAQATVRKLTARFAEANATLNRDSENTYKEFWRDVHSSARQDHGPINGRAQLAPPPPVGDLFTVLNKPSLPRDSEPASHQRFLAWGLGAGLLAGLLGTLAMRRPRGFIWLAGMAALGFILGAAASWMIPGEYTSTAVLQLAPALLTEDPLAAPSPVTPAAAFLRRMEPKVLASERLFRRIRQIDLYPTDGEMTQALARDLRITLLNRESDLNGTPSAFLISFSHSDPHKAQQTVQSVITAFEEEYLLSVRDEFQRRIDRPERNLLAEILQRKAGENLEVLDPPSLPETRSGFRHTTIAAWGLSLGLLLGSVTLFVRRPHLRVPQNA